MIDEALDGVLHRSVFAPGLRREPIRRKSEPAEPRQRLGPRPEHRPVKHVVFAAPDLRAHPPRERLDRRAARAHDLRGIVVAGSGAKPLRADEAERRFGREAILDVFDLGVAPDTLTGRSQPIVIDADLRRRLEDFKNRDPKNSWAWYVQGTSRINKQDFELLTAP